MKASQQKIKEELNGPEKGPDALYNNRINAYKILVYSCLITSITKCHTCSVLRSVLQRKIQSGGRI
jgi:hypothetical protein